MTEWQGGSSWPQQQEPVVEVEAQPELQMTQEEKNALIRNWLEQKSATSAAVEAEKALREKLTAALFPNAKKGTQRYVSPEGFGAIKLVYGYTFTLGDKDKVDPNSGLKVPIKDQVDDLLTDIENLGERGRLIADRIVKWKPELVVSEYEALAASENADDIEAKTLIDALLTVKPASPQVSFEPPKAK